MILPTVRIQPEIIQHEGTTEYHWHCQYCGYWGAVSLNEGEDSGIYEVLDDGLNQMVETGELHIHRCAKHTDDVSVADLPTLWLNMNELLE